MLQQTFGKQADLNTSLKSRHLSPFALTRLTG